MKLRSTVFPASWDAQQQAGVVAGVVEESVSGVRVVKGFGQEQRQVARLAASAERLFGSRVRAVRLTAKYQPSLQAIPSVGQVAVLVLGGYLAIHGHITLGTFLAFSSYVTELQAPVRMLTGLLTVGQQARAGVERVFELLDSTPVVTEPEPDAPDLATVTRRDRVRRRVVRLPALRARAAELLAAGRAGRDDRLGRHVGLRQVDGRRCCCPASTTSQSGSITIDGTDVTTVTLDSLRRQVGEVFEDSFLFSDTIRSNIAYGRPDATDEEVERRGPCRGGRRLHRGRCPTVMAPSSANAASPCRAGNASASRWPGRSSPTRASSCWTTRRRPSTAASSTRSSRRCGTSPRRARRSSSPIAVRRWRWPTASVSSTTATWSTSAPTTSSSRAARCSGCCCRGRARTPRPSTPSTRSRRPPRARTCREVDATSGVTAVLWRRDEDEPDATDVLARRGPGEPGQSGRGCRDARGVGRRGRDGRRRHRRARWRRPPSCWQRSNALPDVPRRARHDGRRGVAGRPGVPLHPVPASVVGPAGDRVRARRARQPRRRSRARPSSGAASTTASRRRSCRRCGSQPACSSSCSRSTGW